MARMIVADRDYVTKKYKLHKLKEVCRAVGDEVDDNTDAITAGRSRCRGC